MRVCYVQSGGFIGAIKSCEVNTADLGQPEAEQVKRLVEDSGLKQSGNFMSDRARDQKQYEITIEDETNAICISFDEHNIPPEAKTLLNYLQTHAKPGKL
ncbi:protealysin inhibitor emfourin [Pseudomonas viridiflava]|uniref:protealysin inhibitor emfourin n=1 Tax=Pseudomonas viridiflava TaxID=33069 RepID=UPI000F068205|nr:protealysin inhibitor emfourin [Pseudomonas viridiflava]